MSDQPSIPNNAEIDKALKEFEAQKYHTEQPSQTMVPPAIINPVIKTPEIAFKNNLEEGVSFDTDDYTKSESYKAIKLYNETSTPKMVKLVMKVSRGAIKDQKKAEWTLLGFVVLVFGISVFLFLHFNLPNTVSAIDKNDPVFSK